MTETEWAKRNLELAGWLGEGSPYDGMIGEAVCKLLDTHAAEGHSGGSHFPTVALFAKVAKGEALTLEFWKERFADYNRLAAGNNFEPWTEEKFEEIVMKKPKQQEKNNG